MNKSTQQVYLAIVNYYEKYKYVPTVRELCNLTGAASTSTIHYHLSLLKEKGYIESDHNFLPGKWRISDKKFEN